jgi:hypothetical protein
LITKVGAVADDPIHSTGVWSIIPMAKSGIENKQNIITILEILKRIDSSLCGKMTIW